MNPREHPSSPVFFPAPVHLCSTLQDFQSHSKIAPQILVETTLCLTSLGRELNPRASSCLTACIIGNSEECGTQSLAGFPVFFKKFQDSISCLCPINSLAETQTNGRKMLPLIPQEPLMPTHRFPARSQACTFFTTQ